MPIYSIGEDRPQIDETAYVADAATVIGRVTLAAHSSVWSNAVLRADNEPITIGEGSNVQEGAVLHCDPGFPLVIGKNVTIGHQAMVHGCTVGDGSLIGIQAVLLNGVVIGKNCLVGAGAVVTENKTFPDNSLIIGAPAKVVRALTPEAIEGMAAGTREYVQKSARFKSVLKRVG